MREELTIEESISINAPITVVWEALTTPEVIKRWFFGVDTETDWKPGGPIVHRGEYQGNKPALGRRQGNIGAKLADGLGEPEGPSGE